MVRGVFSGKQRFLIVPITFLTAWLGIAMDDLRAQPPEADAPKAQAAEAEKSNAEELSGFELLEAYAEKLTRLETFQRERLLRDTDIQDRKSRAADEVNRVMGGLKLLMDQEAQRLFDEAMSLEDPKERDRILEKLRDSRFQLQDVRRRAEYELNRRTVDGVVYPTLEEAKQKARELEAERQKRLDEVDQKDLEDLETLMQDLLNERITDAAKAFAEDDARMMLEKAQRLVLSQKRELLEEILRKHPETEAAGYAKSELAQLQSHNQLVADHKLHKALASSVLYDKRWRRLKEIELYHPETQAAWEAKRIFENHLAQVPPVLITNRTAGKVELTVDMPYSRLKNLELKPGQMESVASAFPLVIRVNIGNNEWTLYRALPGMQYVIETTEGLPVLICLP